MRRRARLLQCCSPGALLPRASSLCCSPGNHLASAVVRRACIAAIHRWWYVYQKEAHYAKTGCLAAQGNPPNGRDGHIITNPKWAESFNLTRTHIHLAPFTLMLFLLCAGACSRNDKSFSQAIADAAGIIDNIAGTPADTVPDAVLNRTKCLVVVPRASAQTHATGVVTCRAASGLWTAPGQVLLSTGKLPAHSDLLIFLLTDGAVNSLRAGGLPLLSSSPGPLARLTPIVSPVELRSASVAYIHSGNHFSGSNLNGAIRELRGASPSGKDAKRYATSLLSFFNTITPTGIILHHTAVLPGTDAVPTSARQVDQYHRTRGFDVVCFGQEYHVAYHYLIMPDGKVQRGRPDRCEGGHAPGYNSYIGISVVGDFSSADNPRGHKGPPRPTPQQLKSLVELCRKLRKEYNIPLQHILRHSDVAPTKCPGDRFPFQDLLAQLANPG